MLAFTSAPSSPHSCHHHHHCRTYRTVGNVTYNHRTHSYMRTTGGGGCACKPSRRYMGSYMSTPPIHIYVMSCTYNVSVYVCTCQYIACSSCAGALAPPDVWVGVEVVVCDACSGITTYFFYLLRHRMWHCRRRKKGSGLKGKKNFK